MIHCSSRTDFSRLTWQTLELLAFLAADATLNGQGGQREPRRLLPPKDVQHNLRGSFRGARVTHLECVLLFRD